MTLYNHRQRHSVNGRLFRKQNWKLACTHPVEFNYDFNEIFFVCNCMCYVLCRCSGAVWVSNHATLWPIWLLFLHCFVFLPDLVRSLNSVFKPLTLEKQNPGHGHSRRWRSLPRDSRLFFMPSISIVSPDLRQRTKVLDHSVSVPIF